MFPGYVDAPYHSPIIVRAIRPQGDRHFELDFVNIGYAAGVQRAQVSLRTLNRGVSHLAAHRAEGLDRTYLFMAMNRAWLQMHIPHLGNETSLFDEHSLPIPAAFEALMR